MKQTLLRIVGTSLICFSTALPTSAQQELAQVKIDPSEVNKNWSLFSEYQKNSDCKTAIPYGWNVLRMNPKRFKTLYTKMGECYYAFYEKETDANIRKAYADTMVMLYDLGIQHVPDRASTYWLSKAYALENYFEGRDADATAAYEKAISLDPKTDFAYVDRLGVLYIKHIPDDPANKQKAIEHYQKAYSTYVSPWDFITVGATRDEVSKALGSADKIAEAVFQNLKTISWIYEKEKALIYFVDGKVMGWNREGPPTPKEVATERLKKLITDPKELIEIAEKQLATDPNNIERIWNAAQAHIQAEQYDGAEKHLNKLIKMAPKTANYWNELARVQQRQQRFKQAIESYEKALTLNPALKENLLNITVCYREMNNYSAARTYALRAAQREKGWGRPYFEIAEVYKAAVERCIRETKGGDWSKLDINDKLVYKLAADSYARAKTVESSNSNEADIRFRELSTLVPSREDYFFHRVKIQNGKMVIESPCYTWIGEPVPVPPLR